MKDVLFDALLIFIGLGVGGAFVLGLMLVQALRH